MCLIGFALDRHPRFPLILAANRDEFHERPAEPARFWRDHHRVLAGRDCVAGGTWMGIATDGRLAAVTNFREGVPRDATKRSRGELVTSYLSGTDSPETYATKVADKADAYAGFSLLLFEGAEGWFVSNRDGEPQRIEPGIHALSNHLLNTPWPKVRRMTKALESTVGRSRVGTRGLMDALGDRREADRDELPDTGVGRDLERMLSPPFVVSPEYGTRCSTVVTVAASGRVHFEEWTFDSGGRRLFARRYRFTLGNVQARPAPLE